MRAGLALDLYKGAAVELDEEDTIDPVFDEDDGARLLTNEGICLWAIRGSNSPLGLRQGRIP
jgi:hypothetical protein